MKKTVFIFLLALLCGTAQAQGSASLSLIFESEPGTGSPLYERLGGYDALYERLGGYDALDDANGDGTSDLILTHVDDDGILQAIRVVDVASGTTLWEVQNVMGILAEKDGMKIFGFADPDADGEPEAIFVSEQDAVLINPSDNSLEWSCGNTLIQMGADPNCVLVGVTDMTDDGYVELILYLPETKQVQVWSRAQ